MIAQTLLFGDEKLSITDSKSIEATIQFLISSGRFDSPLLLDILFDLISVAAPRLSNH